LTNLDIDAIRKDLKELVKPSWVTSLPKDLGSKRHGKLKADQWRAVATVFLPITLIRRWGSSQNERIDPQKLEMLDNTMDLVNAVIVASRKSIGPEDTRSYMFYMSRYLKDLKRLYPHLKLRPVHHAALHLGEFLEMYGPVHGWWTFPFERLIGTLQKVETNDKQGSLIAHHPFVTNHILGEMEQTMLRTFIATSNMKNILTSPRLPAVLQHCKDMLD
ncbi:hypothetical protein SISNIDRAFT_393242, partial [Sistotremastrum niveocremeum HHB9708]